MSVSMQGVKVLKYGMSSNGVSDEVGLWIRLGPVVNAQRKKDYLNKDVDVRSHDEIEAAFNNKQKIQCYLGFEWDHWFCYNSSMMRYPQMNRELKGIYQTLRPQKRKLVIIFWKERQGKSIRQGSTRAMVFSGGLRRGGGTRGGIRPGV